MLGWGFALRLVECRRSDLEFLAANYDATVVDRLQKVADATFQRLSYTEAVDILVDAIRTKKKKFENKVGRSKKTRLLVFVP